MVIARIGPFSLAKIAAALYGVLGFAIGLLFSLVAITTGFLAHPSGSLGGGISTLLFGGFAVITMPIAYGAFGFVAGLFSAFLYNLCARLFGGIEIELKAAEQKPPVASLNADTRRAP